MFEHIVMIVTILITLGLFLKYNIWTDFMFFKEIIIYIIGIPYKLANRDIEGAEVYMYMLGFRRISGESNTSPSHDLVIRLLIGDRLNRFN